MSDFWRDRRVLVTGQTGFKGSWLCLWLERLGARVAAFALPPSTSPSLYRLASPWTGQAHETADLRGADAVLRAVQRAEPEIVFHLAAQALVRASYRDPIGTYASNVMGTLHLLEAARGVASFRAMVVVTSDKVYANDGGDRAFVETDRLGGKDPYSNSKACVELVVQSFRDSFLGAGEGRAVATARAGNILGGGDWAEDRLVPDIVRALVAGQPVQLRHPKAVRPWQHVLEPLRGYLMLGERLLADPKAAPPALNFGPAPGNPVTVAELAEAMAKALGTAARWQAMPGPHPPEAARLTLDSGLAAQSLGWRPRLTMAEALAWTAEWYQAWRTGGDARDLCLQQIARYEALDTGDAAP